MNNWLRRKSLGMLEALSPILPDELFLRLKFPLLMGSSLHLRNPRTFSEKLQWMKLHDRRDIYTQMADKASAKEIVASRIGEEHLIPTLGIWEHFEDIDFDCLPEQFVLKCTHDSGSAIICKDKSSFDIESAGKKLSSCLRQNFYLQNREWPYKNIKPQIIAEPFIADIDGATNDYKFFCIDGEPKFMFIASDRGRLDTETKFDFFDMDFNFLPFTNGHPNSTIRPSRPEGWEEMKSLARKLAEGLPFVRIDFYDLDGHIYFGEYTFCHWGGMKPFSPAEWDLKLGDMLKI